jgi:tellurite resistance protein TerC
MQAHVLLFWILFNLFVLLMLALDLGVFHRRARLPRFREALAFTAMWAFLAALFAVGVYLLHGRAGALEFTTGYVVELALSVDNLFVFLIIFRYFRVPSAYQHKVLYWGILGALLTRACFILAGVALIRHFHWIIYLLGAFLVYTGIRMGFEKTEGTHPEGNPVLRWVRRLLPVTPEFVESRFLVRRGRLYATPLLLVLVVVETTDILFAADSIPAILAITKDAFIVYTSNVFAILGLRSIYFVLAEMLEVFHYLNYGLSVILSFIGVKMLISQYYAIPTGVALGVVAAVLALAVLASLAFAPQGRKKQERGIGGQ